MTQEKSLLKKIAELPFAPAGESARWVSIVFLSVIFLSGVAHWVFFFHQGEMSFNYYDWTQEYMHYRVLQDGIQEGILPLHLNIQPQLTDRFLAIPDTVLSPQIILLKWLDIDLFIVVHILLLYSIGYWGLLKIRERYSLGGFAFIILFLLFNLNGHITAHLSIGHSMWGGYFLLTWVIYWILELIQGRDWRITSVWLGLIFFGMILQGSFHLVIWCWMFLFVLMLARWKYWKAVIGAVSCGALLSMGRILPAAFTYWNSSKTYVAGYPNLTVLINSFTQINDHSTPFIGGILNDMGWWEYDIFIGFVGMAFIALFGIGLRFIMNRDKSFQSFSDLDIPIMVLFFFSIDLFYPLIAKIPLPLFNAERVASRFIIIPVVFLIVFSVIRLQQIMPAIINNGKRKLLALLLALEMVFELINHSNTWRIGRLEIAFAGAPLDKSFHIIKKDDPVYITMLLIGWGITLIGVCVIPLLFRWAKKNDRLWIENEKRLHRDEAA